MYTFTKVNKKCAVHPCLTFGTSLHVALKILG